ncbi:hypothetical protein QFC19_002134 [Naganishia cerealis]|uniref:Uncharacterized protein n=1 Tax=Naganishia cerealis TaxID=610337 RepID=A0ACC2WDG7_9TREE|nr:hypothetical protein QFC19_002134 [Naganishia cerealis]
MSLSPSTLAKWSSSLDNDLNTQLAASVLRTFNAEEALINRDSVVKNTTKAFNTKIEAEVGPVTNQKSSGRCWLFAATNTLRVKVAAKYKLKEFQLSQAYLFFYDKLEKSNFFLDQIIQLYEADIDSRLVQHLLSDPINDGGQFDMFVNVVEKYGLVPHELYPDAYSATSSRTLNFLVLTKLREFAEVLRENLKVGKDVAELKESMQKEVYRLLVVFLGKPPAIDAEFVWEYTDKDDKFKSLKATPRSFYKDVVGVDTTGLVSLLNDPRNKYDTNITIEKLGNVVGGKTVSYLNMNIDSLSDYAVKRIQSNQPVFFGTHTPIYMDKKRGIMDESLFNYKLIDFDATQNKASRIRYKQSLMTHAMTLTAVHLDAKGKPVRWRVENSWGKESGQEGYYVMDHEYFKQYVYQVVVERLLLSKDHQKVLKDTKNTVLLPPWDPMGALAVFKHTHYPAMM